MHLQTNHIATFDDPMEKESPPQTSSPNDQVNRTDVIRNERQKNEFRKRSHPGAIDVKYLDLPTEKSNPKSKRISLMLTNRRIHREFSQDETLTPTLVNSSNESNKIQQIFNRLSILTRRIRLTRYDVVLLVLNLLMTISLIVLMTILKKAPDDNMNSAEEILTVKFFNVSGGSGGNDLLDDAETAALTFEDRIKTVKAKQTIDMNGLLTLTNIHLIYSNGKRGNIFGDKICSGACTKLIDFELENGEQIDQVMIYEDYRKIDNYYRLNNSTYLIVGIGFRTNVGREKFYGMMNGTQKIFKQDGYFLAYIQGKAGGFIDNLRFIFYKYCRKNSSIFTCTK